MPVASGMAAGVTADGTRVPSEDLQLYSFKVLTPTESGGRAV